MDARVLTRALRERIPPEAEHRLRRVAHGFGEVTSGERMLPSFIVVGAQRSGTTTLFRLLADHPSLVRPTTVKGTGYFDDHYDRGVRWYQAHFPLRRLHTVDRPRFAFECSGYTLYHPLAAGRMARDLPAVEVIALVRDPVERARSAHRHEVARGFETLDFADAVRAEGVRTHGEARRLTEHPGATSFAHRHHSYLQRGEYGAQLRRYVDALGRERVHVVDADAFFARPGAAFGDLLRSLRLPDWAPPRFARWNARPEELSLDPEYRRTLLRHFEQSDHELAALLGREPSWRTGAVR